LVYISANSGARIGLDEDIKARFRVAWVDNSDPAKGFRYLYLTDEDYKQLAHEVRTYDWKACRDQDMLIVSTIHESTQKRMIASKVEMEDGSVRWCLNGLPGGMGVECLQGSGTIARATSEAYQRTMTLTYVTGRSVGIGAYCTRLSRRVIQQINSPIILTGNSALNKLMGREVYTSNNQIGGPKVMGHNGVSQQVVSDDASGMTKVLQWLDYMPAVMKETPRRLPVADTEKRIPDYEPPQDEAYDPRTMLEGFFDYGSVSEAMPGWGRTIVAARATLAGLPIGVLAVETRLVERTVPADPAAAAPQQQVEQQAGQVWYPDSAHKTAQAVSDFNKEGLPLMVFANWRGFGGGLRDMFGEVLKYGAQIVDALREYEQPVLVYVPHAGELRGGAWVVIDSSINPDQMEFYAADVAKGNVLEPDGIVDIKFRRKDLQAVMHRTCSQLFEDASSAAEQAKREEKALAAFRQLAVHFASLHDTPDVMLEKGAIRDVVPWRNSRQYFAKRLRRRLIEEDVKRRARSSCACLNKSELQALLQKGQLGGEIDELVQRGGEPAVATTPEIDRIMHKLRRKHIVHATKALLTEDSDAVKEALRETGAD
jgi:acetyl-CoA carboxylase/biotin carboxylase 1